MTESGLAYVIHLAELRAPTDSATTAGQKYCGGENRLSVMVLCSVRVPIILL